MFGFFNKNSGKSINVNDLDELIGKVNIIDIREEYEFKGGRLNSAKNIPMGKLLNDAEKYLNKGEEYYIICESGARSRRLCSMLTKEGYDVINVSGGFGAYTGMNRK